MLHRLQNENIQSLRLLALRCQPVILHLRGEPIQLQLQKARKCFSTMAVFRLDMNILARDLERNESLKVVVLQRASAAIWFGHSQWWSSLGVAIFYFMYGVAQGLGQLGCLLEYV